MRSTPPSWPPFAGEIAALIGAEPDEIALIRAVSEAISWVAAALQLQHGDRVILTSEEHPSGYLPWLTLRDRLGLELVAIDVDGDDDTFIRDLEAALTANTRAICLSHVTTERGIVLPIDRVSALARERGIVTVVERGAVVWRSRNGRASARLRRDGLPLLQVEHGALRRGRHVRPA